MQLVIDRFEGNFAVCEKDDKTMIDIEKTKLPLEAKEGDVIIIEQDKITIDLIETKKRKSEITKITKNLWV